MKIERRAMPGAIGLAVAVIIAAGAARSAEKTGAASGHRYTGAQEVSTGPLASGQAAPPQRADHAWDQTLEVVRGLVLAQREARLASRLAATITEIGPGDGEAFREGDTLVAFDCAAYDAELARAAAEAGAMTHAAAVKQKLADAGSLSRLQAQLAIAELARAQADVRIAEEKIRNCSIAAPFDGRVLRRRANAHETLKYGDPLMDIIEMDRFEVRLVVPSHWINRVHPGGGFILTVDETGERLHGRIVAVGAQIDNVAQLLEARGLLDRTIARVVAGMTGDVELAVYAPGDGLSMTALPE